MPSKKSGKGKRSASHSRNDALNQIYGPLPSVGFKWLITATITACAMGAIGAYLFMCLIFYQNQAMMIFFPSHKITATPAKAGLSYQPVIFDRAANGQSQLTGWWIPAAQNAPLRNDTILYLHGARGSLSDTVPQLAALHTLGINIFAIDYQGFGQSTGKRPTEKLANRDTLAAWRYLTKTRNLSVGRIVVIGRGAGATFATHLASRRSIAGLVLIQISPTAHAIFEHDARARLLPLFLLAREKMNPVPQLRQLQTPKLFLSWPTKSALDKGVTLRDYSQAAVPKKHLSLHGSSPTGVAEALRPFLRQILPEKQ